MRSATLPSFWDKYRDLDRKLKSQARKAYRLWMEDPYHPSLRFKCINQEENIWAVRITISYRALGIIDGDTVTWFWVGNHDEYEKFFG
ncbi:MAG: hypothetical protein WA705_20895 [Candidatus Ozemobacteraceae bacterium]